jgi:hypothetical protein
VAVCRDLEPTIARGHPAITKKAFAFPRGRTSRPWFAANTPSLWGGRLMPRCSLRTSYVLTWPLAATKYRGALSRRGERGRALLNDQVSTVIGLRAHLPRLRNDGLLACFCEEEHIRQAVQMVLLTRPGTRPLLPEFGCRIHELLFLPTVPANRVSVGPIIDTHSIGLIDELPSPLPADSGPSPHRQAADAPHLEA